MIMRYKGRFGLAAAACVLAVVAFLTVADRPGAKAYGFEKAIEATRDVRTIVFVSEVPTATLKAEFPPDGPEPVRSMWAQDPDRDAEMHVRRKSYAQFDDAGRLEHLRLEMPITEDGSKTVVWEAGKATVWFRTKGSVAVVREQRIVDAVPQQFFDVHKRIEDLNSRILDGKATLENQGRSATDQTERFLITYPDRPGKAEVYAIDPVSNLLTQIDYYDVVDGGNVLTSSMKFLNYNEPIDPAMWQIEAPENAMRVDETTQVVGLAKGDMTDEQIAVEVTKQFFEAWAAKDWAKAGQMMSGVPAAKMEEMLGKIDSVRLVSLGAPVPPDDPRIGGFMVPYKVEFGFGGGTTVKEWRAAVRPVYSQPERWAIHGGI